jgi:hypothetical protein
MKTAKILYVQHGNWVRITGFENVMNLDGLIENFNKTFTYNTTRRILLQYLLGKRVGIYPIEYAYTLNTDNKNEIELRKFTKHGSERSSIEVGFIMREEDFKELLLKLQTAGDRLQVIVASLSDKVNKASI